MTENSSDSLGEEPAQVHRARGPSRSLDSRGSGAYASRHQAAEQRRRTRINERLDLLRKLVPHAERSNTACFLEEVIKYVDSLKRRINELETEVEGIMDNNTALFKQCQDILKPDADSNQLLLSGLTSQAGSSLSMGLGLSLPQLQLPQLSGLQQARDQSVQNQLGLTGAQLTELVSRLGYGSQNAPPLSKSPANDGTAWQGQAKGPAGSGSKGTDMGMQHLGLDSLMRAAALQQTMSSDIVGDASGGTTGAGAGISGSPLEGVLKNGGRGNSPDH
eukprot:gene19475-26136_t